MYRTVVLNVVGLTPRLLGDGTPNLAALGRLENAGRFQQIPGAVRCYFQPLDRFLIAEIDAHEAGTWKIRPPVE